MKRKIIQDFANTMCQMFGSWRMYDDLELLSELPSGRLHIDLLRSKSVHESCGEINLEIVEELREWLHEQLKRNNMQLSDLCGAELTVEMDTDKIRTDKKRIVSFDWRCRSRISTDEKVYSGNLVETHRWHNRIGHM